MPTTTASLIIDENAPGGKVIVGALFGIDIMRIIAGSWGSRRITRPDTSGTRPMPDRVRESIFGILGSLLDTPGALPPVEVADVFAGSGSMGLEALSRGARRCRFFERGRVALSALTKNIASLDASSITSVSRKNAWADAVAGKDDTPFDLVLLDPPYKDSDDPSAEGHVWQYLQRLAPTTAGTQLVVLHHRAKVSFLTPQSPDWRVVDQRNISSNGITILAR